MKGRVQLVRLISLILSSLVMSAASVIVITRVLDSYLVVFLKGREYDVLALSSSLILFLVLFPLGTIGLMYVLDFLTLRLQSRFAWETAILRVKGVHPGRFRQILDIVVEKDLAPIKIPGEFVLTVAATRRGLNSALATNESADLIHS